MSRADNQWSQHCCGELWTSRDTERPWSSWAGLGQGMVGNKTCPVLVQEIPCGADPGGFRTLHLAGLGQSPSQPCAPGSFPAPGAGKDPRPSPGRKLLEKLLLLQRESTKLHGLGDSFCKPSRFRDRSKQIADASDVVMF